MKEYSVGDLSFCVTLARGDQPAVAEYHSRVQPLALFYIENADGVDIANPENGYWQVIYVFCRHSANQCSLVGYSTLFNFAAPFHQPTPGNILRVCQVLVLPLYQRQGHGRRMLSTVYDYAHGHYSKILPKQQQSDDIVQVNVEDPAPGYTRMRNRVDYERYHGDIATLKLKPSASLSKAKAVELAGAWKITPAQVHIVHQLDQFRKTDFSTDDSSKSFRLLVKRRLNQVHQEDLSAHNSKEAKQAALQALYTQQLSEYKSIVKSIEASH